MVTRSAMRAAVTGPAPVAMLAVGAFAIGTDIHVVAGVVGGLVADLGVTGGAAGLPATVFALAYAVGPPQTAGLIDHLGADVYAAWVSDESFVRAAGRLAVLPGQRLAALMGD